MMKFGMLLAVGGLILSAGAARAACVVGDMAGDWMLFAQGSDKSGSSAVSCPITIDDSGNIADASCKVVPKGTVPFTEGRIRLPAQESCNFTATFTLAGSAHKVSAGSLENNHRASGSGVGSFTGGGLFMFSMVRQGSP